MKITEFEEYCLSKGGTTNLFGTTFIRPEQMGVALGNFNSIDYIIGIDVYGRCVGVTGLRYEISNVRIHKS